MDLSNSMHNYSTQSYFRSEKQWVQTTSISALKCGWSGQYLFVQIC